MFYFFVVQNYEYYGDHQLNSKIIESIKQNIGTTFLTNSGKKLDDDIQKVLDKNINLTDLLKRHPSLGMNVWENLNLDFISFN